jgi:serine protease Do
MSFSPPSLTKRVAVWLVSGLLFVEAAVLAFWAGSTGPSWLEPGREPQGVAHDGPPAPDGSGSGRLATRPRDEEARSGSGHEEARVGESAGTRARSGGRKHSTSRDDREREEDSSLFEALERLERQMAAGMSRARESVVVLEYTAAEGPAGSRRVATGVVIDSMGHLLSVRIDPPSSKPAGGQTPVVARDASGRRHLALWIAADPETGLSLLRISPRAVRPIQVATAQPSLGSQVIVVGNPFGLGHSISRGHIAGLDRTLKLRSHKLGGLIQIQAPLYPGDSGAVVANSRGQLLALIRSGLAIPATASDKTDHDHDFGFAITAHDALWVADQLRTHGRVDRAYLGVRLEPVEPPATSTADAAQAGIDDGAFLHDILAGTPAASAGLKSGDAIVALNRQPIRCSSELTDRLDKIPARTTISLDVLRGRGPQRQRLTIALQTASRPDAGLQASLSPKSPAVPTESSPATTPETTPERSSSTTARAPSLAAQPASAPPSPTPAPIAPSVNVIPTSASAAGSVSTPASSDALQSTSSPEGLSTPVPDIRAGQAAVQPQTEGQGHPSAPVSIPPPAHSPLRAAVPPPRAEDLKLTLPQAVTDRFEQLERRIEKLERHPTTPPETRQAAAARHP